MLFLLLLSLSALTLTGIYAFQTSKKNLYLTRGAEDNQRVLKNKLAKLENQKSQSALILHHLNDGVIGVDSLQRIIYMNPSAEAALKISGQAALNKTLMEVTHLAQAEETMTLAIEETNDQNGEIALTYPEEKVLRFSAIGLPQEAGGMRGIFVFSDITQIKNLEKIRREFVANVSHELKTPLTSIHGFIETLLDGALNDPAQSKTFLEMMREDTQRLNRLIHDLLELSRIESKESAHASETIDIENEIRKTLALFETNMKEKRIHTEVQIPSDLPRVSANRDQLKQVLLNLLENAVKYNEDNGLIKISAKPSGAFVEISFEDTGIGIPKEDLQRIFERFYRVDKARTSSTGGTGLGLSIVKHIIEAHGGHIECRSTPGSGSAFIFTLPCL